uniref:Uncharacterized protein n=1 Tax=mine drainage metagenome TaxID=410659 RepID=E6PZI0_9ZZZZ
MPQYSQRWSMHACRRSKYAYTVHCGARRAAIFVHFSVISTPARNVGFNDEKHIPPPCFG